MSFGWIRRRTLMDSPPSTPRMPKCRAHAVDPDLPALMHLHACEYSSTGYFGNEGSEIDLYVYCALHVTIPPYGEGARAVTRTKPSIVSSSARRGDKENAADDRKEWSHKK